MPRFNVMLIYSVEADSKLQAWVKVGEMLRGGIAREVKLEHESIMCDTTGWE